MKAICWAKLLQNAMICCVVWCPPLYVNVRFHCENTGVLNDFQFACWLLNVILFPIKLVGKSLKMRPNIASDRAFFGPQNAYSLVIVSKLNFKANFVSNGHPNGTPNGVQNCPANGLWELQCDMWASGPAKLGFWSQFWLTLTSLGANFWLILSEFATINTSRIDLFCPRLFRYSRSQKALCAKTVWRARWRNKRACALG